MNFCGMGEGAGIRTEARLHLVLFWTILVHGYVINFLAGYNLNSSYRFLSNMRCCRRNNASDNGSSAVRNGNAAGGGGGGNGVEVRTRISGVVTTFFRSKRGREAAFTEVDDTTLDQVQCHQVAISIISLKKEG